MILQEVAIKSFKYLFLSLGLAKTVYILSHFVPSVFVTVDTLRYCVCQTLYSPASFPWKVFHGSVGKKIWNSFCLTLLPPPPPKKNNNNNNNYNPSSIKCLQQLQIFQGDGSSLPFLPWWKQRRSRNSLWILLCCLQEVCALRPHQ